MADPTVIVLPGAADGSHHTDQERSQIASKIQNALNEGQSPRLAQDGPLRQVLAQQDSFYKYINWEDPLRTLGVYIGALSILFGAHHLPLTQLALKAAVTTLGVVSAAEYASRSFGSDSLSTRLRPRQYRRLPESALNNTLRDVHDLIQYAVVEAQRIIYGEDLGKTFGAFVGFASLYALIKVLSPFWLAVVGVTAIFVAPLAASPQGRKVAHDATIQAQNAANVTAQKSADLARDGQAKAAELSSKAQQMTSDASTTVGNASRSGQQTAYNVTSTATEQVRNLPQSATNTINKAPGSLTSILGDEHHNANGLSANNNNTNNHRTVDERSRQQPSGYVTSTGTDGPSRSSINETEIPRRAPSNLEDQLSAEQSTGSLPTLPRTLPVKSDIENLGGGTATILR
ncbi:Reticulon-domain-containing protein [Colletotrichum godetiae]|uniref:Reticulon-like protein n=1 Tax=Colletotrichum godetiae TaxID=1209918 RepID=A0AAJ0ELC2_9PEZI|nr:Reticulon-domain-containing protein [Colletotrichum godetiae]KAK1657375.1 Reticulon-domain-containing protein [Colletotrichum godetiae]